MGSEATLRPSGPGFGTLAGVVALAAALVVFPLLAPGVAHADTDAGSIGVRLLDVPESAAADPRARQYIVDELEPGTTIERRIEISNTGVSPVSVEVYAAAAGIADGTFLGEDGRAVNELSSRTVVSDPTVVVAAGSTSIDTVTITIPDDAAPGEQYGAIWVEARAEGTSDIEIVNRVGIRMYVSVGGDNAAASDFTVDSVTASRNSDGQAVVSATINNTGGRAIDTAATLMLTNAAGTMSAGPYSSASASSIAPGGNAAVDVTIADEVDTGPWTATVTVTSGLLERQVDAVVSFPESGAAEPVPVDDRAPDGTGIVWIVAAAVVFLGLLTAVAIVVRTRRSRRARTAAS